VAKYIITELAVFEVMNDGKLWLREIAHDTNYDEIRAKTEAPYAIASNLRRFGE
jgi:acyl CoA:acetate/3-ketoacid CoA transferase beta subunit